jgi:hypothetical protein
MTCYRGFILSEESVSSQIVKDGQSSVAMRQRGSLNLTCLTVSLSLAVLLAVGCGSSSPTKAGAISVTDPNNTSQTQLTSLAAGSKAAVSMNPTNDRTNAGVDWSVMCGGSPIDGSITGGACGSFAPVHTSNGATSIYTAPAQIPVGTNVTITAAVTGEPAALKTIVLPIVAPPIVVVFFGTQPPSSILASGTIPISAQAENDTAGQGISWTATCASADCGSFKSATTASQGGNSYTAPAAVPADGTVTVTATSVTDPTRSVSQKIAIQTISVSLFGQTTTMQVGVSSNADLLATVANDSLGRGVDWKLSCGSTSANACGTITSHTASTGVAHYKGPASVPPAPVTITATSTAMPSVGATPSATILPTSTVGVMVNSSPASVVLNKTSTLTAQVTNDAAKQGVAWSVSCGSPDACGTVVSTGPTSGAPGYQATYTAPASVPTGGSVIIIATPVSTPANPGYASVTITQTPPVVTIQQQPPASLIAKGKAPVSAVVTSDPANGGVTWSVQCNGTVAGACGYVSPSQTASGATANYVAPPLPPLGQVKIVATSTSDSSVSATSTPVTISADTALSVNFVPVPPTQVQADATVNLNAAVTNDFSNAGIDWQVCASGCGFFTTTPAIPAIPATATTPYVPAVPAVTATSAKGWPSALPIPYTAPSTPPATGAVAIVATAHADGTTSAAASVTITSSNAGPTLKGVVQAGTQPLIGASVSLYAAGTSGYGSASSPIYAPGGNSAITTDSSGSFTLPGGYNCPQPTSQMYLLATGGHVGTNAVNPNLVLMTALGSCNALSSSSVVINEVTTVVSSWAVAPFAPDPINTGLTSYLNLGTSNSNTVGLVNAFATVQNLVDISTGQARFNVPAGNASVPYTEINTFADAVNACVVTGGGASGDGTPCGELFADATIISNTNVGNHYPVPTDTLQAAMQIVQHPEAALGYGTDIADLYNLVSPSSPFQPILTAAPGNLSLSLNFFGGGGLSSSSTANYMALDASGNIWMTDTAGNKVIEWNNLGAAITPSTGSTTASLNAPGALAVDLSGNVWVCGTNSLVELTSLGTEAVGSPFFGGGLSGTCQGMAIDGSSNIWAVNSTTVSKFDNTGQVLSGTGFTIPVSPTDNTGVSLLSPIAIDNSNNVWVGVVNPKLDPTLHGISFAELNNANGVPNFLFPNLKGASGITPTNFVDLNQGMDQTQIAIDSSGTVWIVAAGFSANGSSFLPGSIFDLPPYEGPGTEDAISAFFSPSGTNAVNPLSNPRGIAVDGAGMIWTASPSDSSSAALPNLSEYNPANKLDTPAEYGSPSLASRPLSVSVDSAGNVWVLLSNNTVTEYVGIATPAVTPLSAAVKSRKLGAKP